jgi:hypothetical protein
MTTLLVVCHNDECRDSAENNPLSPRPMKVCDETISAWTFRCETCGARRVVTKNIAGGTFGSGRRDDGTGTSNNKGSMRYRPGWRA